MLSLLVLVLALGTVVLMIPSIPWPSSPLVDAQGGFEPRRNAETMDHFVRVNGMRFEANGEPFFFAGANAYYLVPYGVEDLKKRDYQGHTSIVDEVSARTGCAGTVLLSVQLRSCGPARLGAARPAAPAGSSGSARSWQRCSLGELRDSENAPALFCSPQIFEECGRLRLNVVRLWAFGEGADGWNMIQPQRGRFDEAALRSLDYILVQARRHGVRLLLCLGNYW